MAERKIKQTKKDLQNINSELWEKMSQLPFFEFCGGKRKYKIQNIKKPTVSILMILK